MSGNGLNGRLIVWLLSLLPALALVWRAQAGLLGADPVKEALLETGIWALNFLVLCLFMSPLARYLHMPSLVRYRRQLGLWCFFYSCLHLFIFNVFLLDMDLSRLGKELTERPYIVFGFMAMLLLMVMAVTSIPSLIKKMGARKWRKLHKVIFAVSFLVFLHFLILSRSDIAEPLLYGSVLLFLAGWRIHHAREWWHLR